MENVFLSLAGTLLDLLLAELALELLSVSSSPLPEKISIYKTLQNIKYKGKFVLKPLPASSTFTTRWQCSGTFCAGLPVAPSDGQQGEVQHDLVTFIQQLEPVSENTRAHLSCGGAGCSNAASWELL